MTPQSAQRRRLAGFGARELVVVLLAALVCYLVLVGIWGVGLLADPRWAVKGLGFGILLLPVLGLALVLAEIRFAMAAERLGQRLGPAEPDFAAAKASVEAAPSDWTRWYLLAQAYRSERDVTRGRRAMRRAIALERSARRGSQRSAM